MDNEDEDEDEQMDEDKSAKASTKKMHVDQVVNNKKRVKFD